MQKIVALSPDLSLNQQSILKQQPRENYQIQVALGLYRHEMRVSNRKLVR